MKRADVLFQAMELGCAGDWNDPRLLREQPGEGNLRGRGVFPLRNFAEQIDHGLVGLQGFRREAGQGTAEVVAGECGALVNLAGEEAFAEWAVGDEADAEFFERGDDLLFGAAPPQRVLALQRCYRLHGMGAANGFCAGFREAEVFDLA